MKSRSQWRISRFTTCGSSGRLSAWTQTASFSRPTASRHHWMFSKVILTPGNCTFLRSKHGYVLSWGPRLSTQLPLRFSEILAVQSAANLGRYAGGTSNFQNSFGGRQARSNPFKACTVVCCTVVLSEEIEADDSRLHPSVRAQ